MLNSFETIIWIPIFVILLVIIYQTVKSAFTFDRTQSFIISLCVTILAIAGMKQCFQGSMSVLLVPYAAMGIAILLTSLLMFMGKDSAKRQHPRESNEKTSSEVYDERIKR